MLTIVCKQGAGNYSRQFSGFSIGRQTTQGLICCITVATKRFRVETRVEEQKKSQKHVDGFTLQASSNGDCVLSSIYAGKGV